MQQKATMSVFFPKLDLSKLKGQATSPTNKKKTRKTIKKRKPQVTPFPVKLFAMLEAVERDGNEHIVSWHPDGKSFQVHDSKTFVKDVLPSHFKQTKYKSFQRQLNFYGFQRITSGPLEGSYQHECFVKDNEDLCKEIKRLMQPPHTQVKATTADHEQQQGSGYDSSSESSSHSSERAEPFYDDFTQDENDFICDMFEDKTMDKNREPRRRGSYHMALELVRQGSIRSVTNKRRDSFHEAIDSFAALFDSQRRDNMKEGTRLSFVGGKKFHFLPVDFTDIYGLQA